VPTTPPAKPSLIEVSDNETFVGPSLAFATLILKPSLIEAPADDFPTVTIECGRAGDPAADADRVQRAEWLVIVGICNHLGCVPRGQRATDPKGDYGGWFCPCHGSHFDLSGRVRSGPAPTNMDVPPYAFVDDKMIRIG